VTKTGGPGGSTRNAFVWNMVPSCLLWCLWRKRNDISFKDPERTLVDLESFFVFTLYTWTTTLVAP
jgi:hypothetical protein